MPPKADTKLDFIIDQLKALDQLGPMSSKIDDLHSSLGALREEVDAVVFTVNKHEERISALEKDMKTQKEIANGQQQQLRSLTVRLLNIPVLVGESTNNFAGLRSVIYDRFLEPILQVATSKKELPTVPLSTDIIKSCFCPYQHVPGEQPPPVIIKLASRQQKIAVMKNKRELPLPSSEESASGITRFIMVEDLTPDNHRALSLLSKSKSTTKVWSVDGRIKFVRADKPDTVRTVKSVYDSVSKMLSD